MRVRIAAVALLTLGLLVGAFGLASFEDTQAVAQDGPEYRVIAHTGAQSIFWATVGRGVEAAGNALGVRAVFQGPDQFSPSDQASLIDTAVAAGVDGIATTVSDPTIIGPAIERAHEAGIPVVTLNVPPPGFPNNIDPEFPDFISGGDLPFIGQNEIAAGENIANRVLAAGLADRGGSAVVFNHEPGNAALNLRVDGIQNALSAADIPVEEVEIEGAQHGVSQGIINRYLSNNPDVSAAFGLGPDGTIPFLGAVEELGQDPGDTLFGTFDLGETTLQGIRDGWIVATVDQQQYLQGYYSVQALHFFNQWNFIPANYNTGKGLVTSENVDEIADSVDEGVR